ncbi:MAG: response regulator transcription factor [Allosphingosinicella sp.]
MTPREVQILELVADGNSAKEIAGILGIAPRTVERHTENVRLKMGARNRAHMVTRAVKKGILRIFDAPIEPRACAECLFRPDVCDSREIRAFPLPQPPERTSPLPNPFQQGGEGAG